MARAAWLALAVVSTAQGQFSEGQGIPVPLSTSPQELPLQLSSSPQQQLWHNNEQIKWRPERLFHPDQSLSFQYIKVPLQALSLTPQSRNDLTPGAAHLLPSHPPWLTLVSCAVQEGGVDLHFLDKTHLEGFDGQELVSIGPYTVETRLGGFFCTS